MPNKLTSTEFTQLTDEELSSRLDVKNLNKDEQERIMAEVTRRARDELWRKAQAVQSTTSKSSLSDPSLIPIEHTQQKPIASTPATKSGGNGAGVLVVLVIIIGVIWYIASQPSCEWVWNYYWAQWIQICD